MGGDDPQGSGQRRFHSEVIGAAVVMGTDEPQRGSALRDGAALNVKGGGAVGNPQKCRGGLSRQAGSGSPAKIAFRSIRVSVLASRSS